MIESHSKISSIFFRFVLQCVCAISSNVGQKNVLDLCVIERKKRKRERDASAKKTFQRRIESNQKWWRWFSLRNSQSHSHRLRMADETEVDTEERIGNDFIEDLGIRACVERMQFYCTLKTSQYESERNFVDDQTLKKTERASNNDNNWRRRKKNNGKSVQWSFETIYVVIPSSHNVTPANNWLVSS